MEILRRKKIILGVTGSIAAYKSPLLVRELVKYGAEVYVMMTPSATHFVTPLVMENLSMHPVSIDMFDKNKQTEGAWHIQVAHESDLMIIAPCSATTLSKLANGNCDNALVTVGVAFPLDRPFLVAPAMDTTMWLNPATQRNIQLLKQDGKIIIPPAEGELASGLKGPGRLPDNDVLLKYIVDALKYNLEKKKFSEPISQESKTEIKVEFVESSKAEPSPEELIKEALDKSVFTLEDAIQKDKWTADFEFTKMKNNLNGIESDLSVLSNKKILTTAGPTYEKIDDVRFIGNHSSGKMGFALAEEAQKAGAEVTLISGPVSLPTPNAVHRIDVTSADEMYQQAMKAFSSCDVAICAAAVADFTPSETHDGKIKKEDTNGNLNIDLKQTKDILAEMGRTKNNKQILIGFALESKDEIEYGRQKLINKNCDLMVVNSANKPQSGFGGDDNTITILKKDGSSKFFPPMSKTMCAVAILTNIAEIIKTKKPV